jgi:hypothetical protein
MPNNAPPPGTLVFDLSSMQGFLVDLARGDKRGMRTAQEGWSEVVLEIYGNQPQYGELAGITATDFQRFHTLNDQYDQIMANLPALEKLVEMLRETRAAVDDQRQRLASAFAQSAESRAKASGGDTTLLARYEKTCTYRSSIADKAARTRKKKAELAAAAAKTAQPQTEVDGAPE